MELQREAGHLHGAGSFDGHSGGGRPQRLQGARYRASSAAEHFYRRAKQGSRARRRLYQQQELASSRRHQLEPASTRRLALIEPPFPDRTERGQQPFMEPSDRCGQRGWFLFSGEPGGVLSGYKTVLAGTQGYRSPRLHSQGAIGSASRHRPSRPARASSSAREYNRRSDADCSAWYSL